MKNDLFPTTFSLFLQRWSDLTPVALLFTKFGNFVFYYIWNIQAFNFSSVSCLKDFEISQLEIKTVELY